MDNTTGWIVFFAFLSILLIGVLLRIIARSGQKELMKRATEYAHKTRQPPPRTLPEAILLVKMAQQGSLPIQEAIPTSTAAPTSGLLNEGILKMLQDRQTSLESRLQSVEALPGVEHTARKVESAPVLSRFRGEASLSSAEATGTPYDQLPTEEGGSLLQNRTTVAELQAHARSKQQLRQRTTENRSVRKGVRAQLRNPQARREAFIVKEVLDRPAY